MGDEQEKLVMELRKKAGKIRESLTQLELNAIKVFTKKQDNQKSKMKVGIYIGLVLICLVFALQLWVRGTSI